MSLLFFSYSFSSDILVSPFFAFPPSCSSVPYCRGAAHGGMLLLGARRESNALARRTLRTADRPPNLSRLGLLRLLPPLALLDLERVLLVLRELVDRTVVTLLARGAGLEGHGEGGARTPAQRLLWRQGAVKGEDLTGPCRVGLVEAALFAASALERPRTRNLLRSITGLRKLLPVLRIVRVTDVLHFSALADRRPRSAESTLAGGVGDDVTHLLFALLRQLTLLKHIVLGLMSITVSETAVVVAAARAPLCRRGVLEPLRGQLLLFLLQTVTLLVGTGVHELVPLVERLEILREPDVNTLTSLAGGGSEPLALEPVGHLVRFVVFITDRNVARLVEHAQLAHWVITHFAVSVLGVCGKQLPFFFLAFQ
eukprot:Hpha_TRINITY_DN15122_c1_g8::TRINITY_DN15122_c1_g8_i2::g.129545::m.129545